MLPAKATKVGEAAFYNCGLLTKLAIYSTNITYGKNAFLNTNVTEFCGVTAPEGVDISKIKVLAPVGLTTLERVWFEVNSTLTTVANKAFSNCTGLKEITLPEGVTTIGEYAFENCSSLVSFIMPDSVTGFVVFMFLFCKIVHPWRWLNSPKM